MERLCGRGSDGRIERERESEEEEDKSLKKQTKTN